MGGLSKYSLSISGFTKNTRTRGNLPISERLTGIGNRSQVPSVSTGTTESLREEDFKYSLEQYYRIRDQIKYYKVGKSTRRAYKRTWNRCNSFLLQFDRIPPSWEDRLVIWVTHLVDNRYKSNTVKSYISAIKYCLEVDGIKVDNSNCQLTSLIRACHLQNDTIFIRLPIRIKLLNRLLKLIQTYHILGRGQIYLGRWLGAIFVLAYYGLFRVSELVGIHSIKARDVVYAAHKSKITIYLRSSKTHRTSDPPKVVHITGSKRMGALCPYRIVSEFAAVRGRATLAWDEPFLVHQDHSQITEYQYRENLNKLIAMIQHNPNFYGTHSFRSGRATDLKKSGRTMEYIKNEGRWSEAGTVCKYFRD